jgi:hypothetical protein
MMNMSNIITDVHVRSTNSILPEVEKAYNQELPDKREKAGMSTISTNGAYLA